MAILGALGDGSADASAPAELLQDPLAAPLADLPMPTAMPFDASSLLQQNPQLAGAPFLRADGSRLGAAWGAEATGRSLPQLPVTTPPF